MKTRILLLSLLPAFTLFANPEDAPTDTRLSASETEVILDLVERVEKLEKQIAFLDKQIEVTSKQAFEQHGLYVLRPGDTLGRIAKANNINLKDLMSMNEGINPIRLEVGQIVRIRSVEE